MALLKQVWVGLRPVGSADKKAGRLRKGGSELRWILGCQRHRRGGWVRCRGGDSCGPTGVSTPLRASSACASALPGDTPPVPPLGEQLWALRPRLDGGVPAVNGFTPDARRAVDGWAGACAVTWRSGGRKRGGFWAAEASSYGHSPPTPVSGDSECSPARCGRFTPPARLGVADSAGSSETWLVLLVGRGRASPRAASWAVPGAHLVDGLGRSGLRGVPANRPRGRRGSSSRQQPRRMFGILRKPWRPATR